MAFLTLTVKTTIARWLLEHDADASRNIYSQLPVGSGCNCSDCRNFLAGITRFFPAEFQSIASNLGVDLAKPAELSHYGREADGLHVTGGFYHFIGSILSGADVLQWSGSSGTFHFAQLAPQFGFGFGAQAQLVADPFCAYTIVQLEFQTRVPWIIAELESP